MVIWTKRPDWPRAAAPMSGRWTGCAREWVVGATATSSETNAMPTHRQPTRRRSSAGGAARGAGDCLSATDQGVRRAGDKSWSPVFSSALSHISDAPQLYATQLAGRGERSIGAFLTAFAGVERRRRKRAIWRYPKQPQR